MAAKDAGAGHAVGHGFHPLELQRHGRTHARDLLEPQQDGAERTKATSPKASSSRRAMGLTSWRG